MTTRDPASSGPSDEGSDPASDSVAVNQASPRGGRPRFYPSGAARARAWRERQKALRSEGPAGGEPVDPFEVPARLAGVLEALTAAARDHEARVGELVFRIDFAVGALADPEVVAAALATAKGEADSRVAAADAQAEAAEVALAQCRASAETLAAEVRTVREDRERLRHELNALRAAAATELEGARRQFEELRAKDVLRVVNEATRDEILASEAVAELIAERDGALLAADQLRVDLMAEAQALEDRISVVTMEAAASREELTEQLTARHLRELDAVREQAEADIRMVQEEARKVAAAQAAEVSRLVEQVASLLQAHGEGPERKRTTGTRQRSTRVNATKATKATKAAR